MRRLLVAGLLAVLAVGCTTTGGSIQPSHTEMRRLDRPLTQTFVARTGNVSQIAVLVATYGVEGPQTVLRMDLEGAGETRSAFADLSEVNDLSWVQLAVPPVQDAAGKEFHLTFSAQGTHPVALAVNGHDPYPHGDLSPGQGDLAFEVGHAGRLAGLFGALERIGQTFAARLRADPAFTLVWAGLLGMTLVGLAAALRAQRRAARR